MTITDILDFRQDVQPRGLRSTGRGEGAQGNALRTLVCMLFVLSDQKQRGRTRQNSPRAIAMSLLSFKKDD